MNWRDSKYKHIAEKISDTDIDNMISVMIYNCDNNGIAEGENLRIENIINVMIGIYDKKNMFHIVDIHYFLKTYINNPVFFTLVDETANSEILRLDNFNWDYNNIDDFDYYWEDFQDENFTLLLNKETIYKEILYQIAQEAIRRRNQRHLIRYKKGDHIDLNNCNSLNSYHDKIEFYKDGGWGIADKNGIVIITNHIRYKPSTTPSILMKENCPFRIIQDMDTNLYGVLSLESYEEVIQCLYEKIEVLRIAHKTNKYIIKAQIKGKWGCYDEDFSLIVDCKYDEICLNVEWIEGYRDGSYLFSEVDFNKYDKIYDGVKDLYDNEGNLLIGGYNHFDFKKEYFLFYFGTVYENYCIKKTDFDFYSNDWYDYSLFSYRLNYNNALCLVLDRHFRTIINSNGHYLQVPIGTIINSVQELTILFSDNYLLSGYVEFSDYNRFIYLQKTKTDCFIISNYYEGPILDPFGNHDGQGQWQDYFIEDDEVIILRIIEDGTISWRYKVNEISSLDLSRHIYRVDDKVGFFSINGIYRPMFAAVTTDNNEGKTYAAEIVYHKSERYKHFWNPFNLSHDQYTLRFWEITHNGTLVKINDKRKIFNPTKYKWFPCNFLEKYSFVKNVIEGNYEDNKTSLYEKYGGYNEYDDDTID